ncbi:hypothetical protein C0431_12840 [bacterium]|nr:hypothetical protein [bacterium]
MFEKIAVIIGFIPLTVLCLTTFLKSDKVRYLWKEPDRVLVVGITDHSFQRGVIALEAGLHVPLTCTTDVESQASMMLSSNPEANLFMTCYIDRKKLEITKVVCYQMSLDSPPLRYPPTEDGRQKPRRPKGIISNY